MPLYLRDLVTRTARSYPNKVAYADGRREATWSEMDTRSGFLAGGLQQLGVGKGDVVALLAGDYIELYEHWFACLKIGAVRTGINYRYGSKEVAHIVRDSSARALIVEARFLELLGEQRQAIEAAGCQLIVIGSDDRGRNGHIDYEELIAQRLSPDLPGLADDDLCAISYTSGTTGMPKGAMLTQRGICDASTWTIVNVGLRHEDVWFQAPPAPSAPLIFGSANAVNGMTTILPGAGFDAARFLKLAEQWSVTSGIFVPTQLIQILKALAENPVRLASFRQVCYGSAPAPRALIAAVQKAFGCEMQQWYSATELTAAPAVILRDSQHQRALAGEDHVLASCGVPQGQIELAIMTDAGENLPRGEVGEIWMRGPTVFAGYLNRPEDTAEVLVDGWVRPGDLGRLDEEGLLYILDRKKFLIISGGYNVFPVVVEDVIAEMPGVSEVLVVGAEHPYWGEAVVAAVVPREGVSVDAAEVIEYCRQRLGKWEIPKFVDVIPSLPRNAAAKADKGKVRDWYRSDPARLPWFADHTG